MRKALVLILGVCLLAMLVGAVSARDIDKSGKRIMKAVGENENLDMIDQGARSLATAAAIDSYCLAWYDFEQMNWQGWTVLDNTAQIATFFHVDDFAGLGGGSWGGLYALEGTKSMWCGSRPADDPRAAAPFFYLCSWLNAPGYANSWNQILETGAFPITGLVTFSYHGYFDSEPDFDQTFIEYDSGDDNWVELAMYDGAVDTAATHTLLLSQVATKLRFNFIADGAWSDSDGLWDTDGAAIVDELLITDATGTINSENWEGEALDVTQSSDGFWTARGADAFGDFSGLANNLVDKDPCGDNFATQVIFYQGSSYPSADYPGLFNTPFCTGPGGTAAPCQDQSLISPVIDLTMYSSNRDENQNTAIPPAVLPGLGGLVYNFTVYRDLPLSNLVFYTWSIRSLDEEGCPGVWKDRNFVYYGGDKDYIQASNDVSDLFSSDEVQVTIGVSDMCGVWFNSYGDCAAHTPSPWIDNCRLYRYETVGPQWSVRDLDLFQDTFPTQEFDLESWGRADAANDLRGNEDPVIDPGDSIVVTCTAPMAGGLDTLSAGVERVYAYVYAQYIGIDGLKSDIHGATMQGTYGTWTQTIGNWDVFLMPTALTGAGSEAADKYMLDLNDSLFTRGYQINYYFKAYDLLGASSTLPATAEEVGGNMYEFTILPTLNSEMLFVDDFTGRGTFVGTVQTYWDPTFAAVIPGEMPDRYDVNGPSSLVSNGPGSRAYTYQMINTYEKIIWDSGDLNSGTITEGTDYSDKSNDAQMLLDWMNQSEHKVGLMVMGDQVADDLTGSPAAAALELLSTKCGVTLVNTSYYELTGGRVANGVVTPLVTGVGIYAGVSYYAFGGCPIINSFDVLEKTGSGAYSLQLPDFGGFDYYIGISNSQLNDVGYPLRTSWIGNSMQVVRTGVEGVPARNILVKKTWEFFENDVNEDVTDATIPAKYALM
ncbi:MAG: hypothetical protein MUF59_08605, partial [Candidatus Krumholzibacteria bacterium]|nr:hypothetical protein [Candidatus Krumholzibacteria bacterium]